MIKYGHNNLFWQRGNGREFIHWAGAEVPETDFSTAIFYKVDEEMDALVEGWMKNGELKFIMKSLHSGEEKNLPQDYKDFLDENRAVPGWVDWELMEAGCSLSERSGLSGLLVLRNFALLGGYNFGNLTKPLVATEALEKGAVHRLYNTLGFWVDVSRNGAESQERRLRACIRTRIVHSVSRLSILKKYPDWDGEKFGTPINFADMIATNIAFTVYYLFGLSRIHFRFSEQEEEGTFHLWKYVTWLLGVPQNLIPENRVEALAFFRFWTQYQASPDADALKLTDALLHENTPISLLKLDIVKRNMGYIHRSVANFLIDENIRQNLQVPPVRFKNVIPNALKIRNAVPIDRATQIAIGAREQQSVLEDYKAHTAKIWK